MIKIVAILNCLRRCGSCELVARGCYACMPQSVENNHQDDRILLINSSLGLLVVGCYSGDVQPTAGVLLIPN